MTKGHYLTDVKFRGLTQVSLGCNHNVTGCSFWRIQERPVPCLFELLETTRIPWLVTLPLPASNTVSLLLCFSHPNQSSSSDPLT